MDWSHLCANRSNIVARINDMDGKLGRGGDQSAETDGAVFRAGTYWNIVMWALNPETICSYSNPFRSFFQLNAVTYHVFYLLF
jgi:hypothetical protein